MPSDGQPRIPPHNDPAEQSVLGALLLRPDTTLEAIGNLRPADFYNIRHQRIAHAILRLAADNAPIDTITVAHRLDRDGLLTDTGGITYLNELQDVTPSTSAAGEHAQIVADAATLRSLITHAATITDTAYNGHTPAQAIAAATELLDDLAGSAHVTELSSLEVADVAALLAAGLTVPEPDLYPRTDGTHLFYAGRTHMLQAEPGSGKSWVSLAACASVLDIGGSATFIDYEDTHVGILHRMLALGATTTELADRFTYIQPVGPLAAAEIAHLNRVLDHANPDIIVIDGVAKALSREGLDENSATDWNAWYNRLPGPLAERGAAVILIDHLAKDKEHRGRYARGTGAKLASIRGAVYSVRPITSFSRHRAGASKLVIEKDQPGGIGAIGETAAIFKVDPHADGERVITTLEPAPNTNTGDPWRPTVLMAKVSAELARSPEPLSASQLRSLVHGKKSLVSEAIERLRQEHYIRDVPRGRRTVLELIRPFTDDTVPTEAPQHTAQPPLLDDEHLFGTDTPEPPAHAVEPPPWETHPADFYDDDRF